MDLFRRNERVITQSGRFYYSKWQGKLLIIKGVEFDRFKTNIN